MSATGLVCRGLPTPTSLFFMVIVVVVLGCRCVSGRPQSHQDSREARAQSELRFSPELLLEPSLESAASPASVLPHRPSPSSPSTHHHLAPPYAQTKENHKGVPGDDWQRFRQDLDGPEEKWEHDPDMEDSDIPPTQRWSERTSDLPGDKVVVPPVVMDDLNVDRLQGALTGFNKEDGNEDLDVPELRLKDRDSDPFRTAGSGYIRAPHKVIDQGVPSPELLARDVDVDGPPLPSAHIPMPDDVPADPRQIVPWQAMLEKDVDVDRPIRYYSSPQSLTGEDASRQQWKKLALKDLDVDKDMAALARQDVRTDVDVDAEKNPFEDEEEEEVPEELIRRVVHAMDAPPPWRASSIHQDGEVEDIWAEGSGDSDENADQYIDWVIQEQAVPQSSRLIAMIFEIIDDPEETDDEEEEGEEEEEEEEEEHSAAAYEKELSIWQILTNFPFPMLVSQGDETAIQVDYIYDDDDDDYDDEYDEDDYYDDDEYEDDEDYDDDDQEEDSDDGDEKDDDLDDYFYSEEYDECRDCTEDDGTKQEIVLSLAPMLTR